MDKSELLVLYEKKLLEKRCGSPENDPSRPGRTEAEKAENIALLSALRELIRENDSKAGAEIREKAYYVMGSLLKNTMEPSCCQFLIDQLKNESDKYILSSMLTQIQWLHIPDEVDIEPMIECSQSSAWLIRDDAINALRASDSDRSREAVRRWVRQTDEKTYKYELIYAHASLGFIGMPEDIELLETHTHSRIRDVRDTANYAIGNIKARFGLE